ncbi:hypothetical protein BKA82DRAFT_3971387 [Pisolithus tinctorius]|nr:hypothetical protein BKA82DRAFT_3971387 [Pisolithus tinctorius]
MTTTDNFRVDLSNTPSSAWNTSASHVFAASFCDAHPGCGRSLKAIFNAWAVHFNYLRQVYAKQQMVAREEQARISNLASGYTNEQDYESPLASMRSVHRRRECKLQQLGPAGMSSDESEHDISHGEWTYRITRKAWRSATVTAMLHVLDALHLQAQYQQQWNATAGAWPHLRVPSSQLSNREPPLGLPKNFYVQEHLSSLTLEGLDNLLLQEDIPLNIPPAIVV